MKLLQYFQSISSVRDEAESLDDSVSRLLLENLSSLYSLAYRLCGERSLAEDFVQETARKALEGASKLRHNHHLRAWLFKILTNVARDHFRRNHSWEEPSPEEEDLAFLPDFLILPDLTTYDVRKAVSQLAPFHRTIILIVDIEDFTLAETAEMLQIPIGTVASRLARARNELRLLLVAYRSERAHTKGTP